LIINYRCTCLLGFALKTGRIKLFFLFPVNTFFQLNFCLPFFSAYCRNKVLFDEKTTGASDYFFSGT